MKRFFKNILILSAVTSLLMGGIYCTCILYTGTKIYMLLKQKNREWYGMVHRCDPGLGFAPIPGARGAHMFPAGPPVPMRYGAGGFRVPVLEDIDLKKRPLFLFLGSSYTYGDACRAEDTFPWLVAKRFGATALNAGVCGYGLAQMLILAEKLIPEYRPEFVIVEHADWLVTRATREFGPACLTKIPYPYFTEKHDGLAIAPPVYKTAIFDKDISRYRTAEGSAAEYCSFMTEAALPLKMHEDYHYLSFLIKKVAGLVPEPAQNRQKVCDYFYAEVEKLCRSCSAKMIVVGFKKQSYTLAPSLYYADTEKALKKNMPSEDAYEKAYAHWRGNPPVKVDNHPNPLAHRIIAGQIIGKIRERY